MLAAANNHFENKSCLILKKILKTGNAVTRLLREKRKLLGIKTKTPKNIFSTKKEILNNCNIRKSWFDHEEESWNLESCSENTSVRKLVILEDDINYYHQENYSDYDEYTNDATNIVN